MKIYVPVGTMGGLFLDRVFVDKEQATQFFVLQADMAKAQQMDPPCVKLLEIDIPGATMEVLNVDGN